MHHLPWNRQFNNRSSKHLAASKRSASLWSLLASHLASTVARTWNIPIYAERFSWRISTSIQKPRHHCTPQCKIGDTFNGKRSKDHLHNGLANPPPNSSIVGKLTKVPEVFVSTERDWDDCEVHLRKQFSVSFSWARNQALSTAQLASITLFIMDWDEANSKSNLYLVLSWFSSFPHWMPPSLDRIASLKCIPVTRVPDLAKRGRVIW